MNRIISDIKKAITNKNRKRERGERWKRERETEKGREREKGSKWVGKKRYKIQYSSSKKDSLVSFSFIHIRIRRERNDDFSISQNRFDFCFNVKRADEDERIGAIHHFTHSSVLSIFLAETHSRNAVNCSEPFSHAISGELRGTDLALPLCRYKNF